MKKILLILAAVLTFGLAACAPGGAGTSPTFSIPSIGPTLEPTAMPSEMPSSLPSEMPSGSAAPSATY